jgi:hypothetical protein
MYTTQDVNEMNMPIHHTTKPAYTGIPKYLSIIVFQEHFDFTYKNKLDSIHMFISYLQLDLLLSVYTYEL